MTAAYLTVWVVCPSAILSAEQQYRIMELHTAGVGTCQPHAPLAVMARWCQCHILHRAANGYGSCMHRGKPRADCSCAAHCPVCRCGQYDCVSRLGVLGHSVSSSAQLAADDGGNSDDLQPAQRRHSGRALAQPQLFADEQAAERELAAVNREINQMEAAEEAVAQQPAVAAPALQPPAAPVQPDTQLPTVADIASHRPLYDTLSYALQPLWRDI